MKKIIYIGTPLPENKIAKHKTVSFNIADNIAQVSLIKGLFKNYEKELVVLTECAELKCDKINIGGVDATVIRNDNKKRISYYLSLLFKLTKILNSTLSHIDKKDKTIIITRGVYIFISLPVLLARLRGYKIIWIPFIITSIEVPGQKFPLNIISWLSRLTSKKADGAITYVAKSPQDYMPGKPFQEISYAIDKKIIKLSEDYNPTKSSKFTIAYTGALSDTYNFDYVIDTIHETKNRYHWVFAGKGTYEKKIKELSANKKYDVDYLGEISNEEAIKLQKASHLLISPRASNKSKVIKYYSKYAASGKLTEYLCSGVPILASDVPSTSAKIKTFINNESGQTAQHIIGDIENIISDYDKKVELAKKGQQYAFKYFNEDYQNKKIYDFLESL